MSTPEALAWLRAEIVGDKRAAEAAPPGPWDFDGDDDVYTVHDGEHGDLVGNTVAWAHGFERQEAMGVHIVLHQPRDVLADCEAKLAILDEHEGVIECDCGQMAPCRTVRAVASAYRHRPGYPEHWGSDG